MSAAGRGSIRRHPNEPFRCLAPYRYLTFWRRERLRLGISCQCSRHRIAFFVRRLTGPVLTTSYAVAAKCGQHIMHRFLETKLARFDPAPRGAPFGLVPERQRLLGRVDRRADVLATPGLSDQ